MKLRNMEEKISYRLFLMGFVGLVCTAALCIFVFHRAFTQQAWAALENEASLVAAACQLPEAAEHLEDFAPEAKSFVSNFWGAFQKLNYDTVSSVLSESNYAFAFSNIWRRAVMQAPMMPALSCILEHTSFVSLLTSFRECFLIA